MILILGILLMNSVNATNVNTKFDNQAAGLEAILAKPLISGASVSADRGATSPGKKLALRYTTAESIRTLAADGRPGRETIRSWKENTLDDRTIVFALDFFFWDSVLSQAKASLEAMRDLIARVKKRNIPIVLGDIPALLPAWQPQREVLNREIHGLCQGYDKCRVFPLDRLHQQVMRDGHIEIGGKRYGLRQLVPDGLHLAEVGRDYLADTLKGLLTF